MGVVPRSMLRVAALGLLLAACPKQEPGATLASPSGEPTPPIAKLVPHPLEAHGHTRIDNYYWMRERDDTEVIAYLEAENAYTEAMTAELGPLIAELRKEMTGRLVQDDSSVPYRDGDYYYYVRWEQGADYPLYCRKHGSLDAPEQIFLDAQALAAGHEYFELDELDISEDARLLAYSVDTVGRRFYTIYFVDLQSGERLPDRIPDVAGSMAWANDNKSLFYLVQDPETLRENRVYRHVLGDDPQNDTLVYEETDETFSLGLRKTKSGEFVVIDADQTLSSEVRLIDADAPASPPRVVHARERGLEYEVDHRGDRLYIRTNLDAPNFRVVTAPLEHPSKQHWQELIPPTARTSCSRTSSCSPTTSWRSCAKRA